jgi:hypothetical protein
MGDVSGADPRKPDPDRVAGWREAMSALEPEIRNLEWYRDEMSRLIEIVRANRKITAAESYFPEHVMRWYLESQCMRVRRITESDSPGHDVWSLRLILEDMRRAAEAFTKGNVRELFDETAGRRYEPEFEDFLVESMWRVVGDVDKNADRLRPKQIKEDLKLLADATDSIKAFATKVLAHYTKEGVGIPIPSWGPIASATDVIVEIAKRYYATLIGPAMLSFAPHDQFDWYDVFRFAWKPSQGESER